ncbi:MAG: FecR domain-containing protein [Anaerolineales bacterium]|nr:FecR domain-containing protein [Anaerolineales bacterium]
MNEELSLIFAECTEAIELGRLTVDDCLDKYPQYRTELIDLLQVAMLTRAVPTAVPATEFRLDARERLLAHLPPRAAVNGKVTSSQLGATMAVTRRLQPAWQTWRERWPWPALNLAKGPSLAVGAAFLLVILFLIGMWLRPSGEETELAQENLPVQTEPLSPEKETGVTAPEITPEGSQEEVAAAIPSNTFHTYIPAVSNPLDLNAQTAAVEAAQGVVEVQSVDGTWTAVNSTTAIAAGQRVRTGELSQATLTFYDGSQASLSANTEISLDELNALRPEEGFRTVVMTQWVGDSDHSVQFRNDGGSRYEVKTPASSGIARGTKFHVLVTPESLVRYIVTEGKVDVTGQSQTVSVTAGQLTSLTAGSVPSEPAFSISGEGEVSAIGPTWTIAGQTFQTHEHTLIVGNPQVGDLVHVTGHLLPDGSRAADRIILLRRAVANHFSLSGEVEAIGATWTIAGQTILVNDETIVGEGIAVGDSVRVEGLILPGGTLQAQSITRLEAAPGLPFQFSGIVQAVNGDSWTISGQVVGVNGETAVADGIIVGDVVAVQGWILEDGTWLATEIRRQTETLPTFEFTGVVQSVDPWQAAGIGFETRPWTIIAPGIAVGDRVRVHGSILSDGTWVADTIMPLTDTLPNTVVFIGVVSRINPWVVNGLILNTTNNTIIADNITVGSLVVVQAQLLRDGTWTVSQIRPLYPTFGLGCLVFSSPVIAVNANTIQVRHWQGDIDRAYVQGDVAVNDVVTLPVCAGWDGTIIIIGTIVVIYQPVVIIIDDGGWSPPGGIPPGCKITGIGNNNPHLKCSGGGSKKS